jgi:hypothetical protein
MFWVVLHLCRRSLTLTLNILQMRSVHRSWDFEIGVHFDGRYRLDCESGYEESRSVDCGEDCAIDGGGNEIGPSVNGQKMVAWK